MPRLGRRDGGRGRFRLGSRSGFGCRGCARALLDREQATGSCLAGHDDALRFRGARARARARARACARAAQRVSRGSREWLGHVILVFRFGSRARRPRARGSDEGRESQHHGKPPSRPSNHRPSQHPPRSSSHSELGNGGRGADRVLPVSDGRSTRSSAGLDRSRTLAPTGSSTSGSGKASGPRVGGRSVCSRRRSTGGYHRTGPGPSVGPSIRPFRRSP
jgi:hypothetical protein